MIERGAIHLTIWTLVALGAARVRAQTRIGTVEVDAERASQDGEEAPAAQETAFVTVIDARRPEARTASVADLIEREASVQLRSLGGLGAFTAVSIRGADPSQVAVFLDGVPLNRASAAVVDLSQLPADDLERIEIYRGMVPVELGGQAVGGAINLVTRRARRAAWRATLGGGSFGARSATVGWSGGGERFHADASAAYRGARGDFLYYDYRGTLLDRSDDRPLRRDDNDFDQLALDATLEGGGRTRVRAGAHGFLKAQGVPGRGGEALSRSARFDSGRLLASLSVERRGWLAPELDGRLEAYALYERAIFKNPLGEAVGSFLRSVTDSDTLSAGASARAQAALGAHQLVTVLATVDVERFAPRELTDPSSVPPPSSRVRASMAIADELRLASERVVLTPALRIDGVANDLGPGLGVRGLSAEQSTVVDSFLSPRLGARVAAAPWLALKGSIGRFLRLPTTIELFGDGAFVLPRPALKPETALSGDLGAELALARRRLALTVEGALFGRQVDDYIALVPAGHALAAINVGDERFLGLEARARLEVASAFRIALDYTLIHTVNGTGSFIDGAEGKQLPGVPRHRLSARAELAGGPLRCFYELIYTSDVWRDAQNTDGAFIPGRALHAVGASAGPFARWPITLSVEVRNLADLRVVDQPLGGTIHAGETTPYPLVDVYDYPLPGRAIYATLAWRP